MKNPAVSVIIPMYNAEKYVGECLDSLLAQTFQDFEVIVVDDCSTDTSVEVVKSYMPKFNGRLRLSKTETNSGGCAEVLRNIGLKQASGEYILFVDADDYIDKTALAKLCKGTNKINSLQQINLRSRKSYADTSLICPSVSVVISMYNSEKYIGECLESLLAQTFQGFEIIIVDDCSTDNSVAVVESYMSNFGGRIKLAKTQTNSGRPGEPRNIGVDLSRGEYLLILDSDDTITPDALEKFYKTAKEFDADLVICEKFYRVPEEHWNDAEFIKQLEPYSYQQGGFVKTPTLLSFDIAKRVQDCCEHRFLSELWNKFIRRDYLLKNQIRSQSIRGNDFLMTCCLYLTAERIIRVPYVVNYYRIRKDSLYHYHLDCEPLEKLTVHMQALHIGFKYFYTFLSRYEFFQQNPEVTQLALNAYFHRVWKNYIYVIYDKIHVSDIKASIQQVFRDSANVEFIAFLFETLQEIEREKKKSDSVQSPFKSFITARIELKLMTDGDFEIFSVSDDKAKVSKPQWLNRNGSGYLIISCVGLLKFIAKATADGQINLNLRGMDVRDPDDKSKKIPYWIDYTKLAINGKIIFDTLTPAWHDKPYRYDLDVKADEEITVQVEWQPHIDKRIDVTENAVKIPAPSSETVKPKIEPPTPKIIAPKPEYETARLDVKFASQTAGSDFKILSLSDDKAEVKKPAWFQKNGIGYAIQSDAGKLEFIAKATADGQLNCNLKGISVANPNNPARRIPYRVYYTNLTVNEQTIFNKVTSAWNDKPYRYSMDVKAGDEIKIHVEWQPKKSNV